MLPWRLSLLVIADQSGFKPWEHVKRVRCESIRDQLSKFMFAANLLRIEQSST